MKNVARPIFLFVYIAVSSIGAFTGGMWAVLGLGGALLAGLSLWAADKNFPRPPRAMTVLTLTILALMAAELPFSFSFAVSWKVWLQLASIFLPLLLLTSPRLQQSAYSPYLFTAAALAMLCGAVFLWLELSSGGVFLHLLRKPDASLTGYNRGMAHLVILAFPVFAALVLSQGRIGAAVLALLLLLPAGLTESHTAKLALIMGSLCALAACARPLWTRNALGCCMVLALGWPFIARAIFTYGKERLQGLHASWLHRMEIWDYLSYRAAERPLFGWGLGTTHLLDYAQPHGDLYRFVLQPASHAHNFAVTLWVETGLFGVLASGAFLLAVLRAAYALHPLLRPYALGCLAAALTVASFGFDFWTDALWSAFALSAFAFGIMQQRLQRGQNLLDI